MKKIELKKKVLLKDKKKILIEINGNRVGDFYITPKGVTHKNVNSFKVFSDKLIKIEESELKEYNEDRYLFTFNHAYEKNTEVLDLCYNNLVRIKKVEKYRGETNYSEKGYSVTKKFEDYFIEFMIIGRGKMLAREKRLIYSNFTSQIDLFLRENLQNKEGILNLLLRKDSSVNEAFLLQTKKQFYKIKILEIRFLK
jgi:hypothetical protein